MPVDTFSTPGATTWSPGAGGTAIVEVWGAGGGGGVGAGGEGGGGGGAYSIETAFAFTGGSSYDVFVGAGGAPSVAGTDSWFDTTGTVLAKGGAGGVGRVGGAGGAAASGVGDTKRSGGNGGTGVAGAPAGGGGGGSSAGTAAGGSNGGNAALGVGGAGGTPPVGGGAGGNGGNTTVAGSNGTAPGGGAGGGGDAANAGTGADGKVVVTYTYDTLDGAGGIEIGGESTAGTGTPIASGSGGIVIAGESTAAVGEAGPIRRAGAFGDHMSPTNLGPHESGTRLVIPILLVNSLNVGVTGVADSDLHIAKIAPDGTKTDMTWGVDATLAEIDATNFEGAYKITLITSSLPTNGVWNVLVYPTTPGAYFGVPCNFLIEVVNTQWPRFSPLFGRLFRRMNQFLDREGVEK